MATGLLLVRLVFGLLMAAHGSQKIFGWFGGYGLTGTGTFFEQLGFRPGRLFAAAAGWTEFLGGVLLAVGLGGPVGPAFIVSVMIVALVSVHRGHGNRAKPRRVRGNREPRGATVSRAIACSRVRLIELRTGRRQCRHRRV